MPIAVSSGSSRRSTVLGVPKLSRTTTLPSSALSRKHERAQESADDEVSCDSLDDIWDFNRDMTTEEIDAALAEERRFKKVRDIGSHR